MSTNTRGRGQGGSAPGKLPKVSTDAKEEGHALSTSTTTLEEHVLETMAAEPVDFAATIIKRNTNLLFDLEEDEYQAILMALVTFVDPGNFHMIGFELTSPKSEIFTGYLARCQSMDAGFDAADMERLFHMGVRPSLLKERSGTIEMTSKGVVDHARDLIALLVPKLNARGHVMMQKGFPSDSDSDESTAPSVRGTARNAVSSVIVEAKSVQAKGVSNKQKREPNVKPTKIVTPAPDEDTSSDSDEGAVEAVILSEPVKKKRELAICSIAGYEREAGFRIEDIEWIFKRATEYVQRWYIQNIRKMLSRPSAIMPEHVLCAGAASWYRVFDRGKGHWYRVFDRGKEMGAVSRDYFCLLTTTISGLSPQVDTFSRASFDCYTYTCKCSCIN